MQISSMDRLLPKVLGLACSNPVNHVFRAPSRQGAPRCAFGKSAAPSLSHGLANGMRCPAPCRYYRMSVSRWSPMPSSLGQAEYGVEAGAIRHAAITGGAVHGPSAVSRRSPLASRTMLAWGGIHPGRRRHGSHRIAMPHPGRRAGSRTPRRGFAVHEVPPPQLDAVP